MSESEVFKAVIKLPAEQRQHYLDQRCAGNAALKSDVESLLQAHEASQGILLEQSADGERTHRYSEITERPGSQIGPYKLLEQIGDGGFGVVFMAEQLKPVRRKVALKVIKPGMDTRQVIARFEAERQALALMDHPNIARVFDAGETASGRPYFVMELVKGAPITQFCDDAQLETRERLELFIAVCQATQHAHQKGVIHRDLKPSNILVTLHDGAPVVKVIDFGVAKATGQQLTEKTLFTGFSQFIGTPLYMSPEQAALSGLDIDTRSDVYSLGVLLYELLTGTTPLEKDRLKKAAFDEIRRWIREEEPVRPSTRISALGATATSVSALRRTEPHKLSQLLRNELDWVVMKALEKDRTNRYETASGLARDVQRYLAGDAVEACPPTLGYRILKTYRKHRAAVLTTAGFALVMLAATAISGTAWIAAETAKRDATKALIESEKDRKQKVVALDDVTHARDAAEQARDHVRTIQRELVRSLYDADMAGIPSMWDSRKLWDIQKMLETYRPKPENSESDDLRGFEWYYWDRRIQPDVNSVALNKSDKQRQRVSRSVFGTISPDVQWIALLVDNYRETEHKFWLKIINADTQEELLSHPLHATTPRRLDAGAPVFSRDEKFVGVDWDPTEEKDLWTVPKKPGGRREFCIVELPEGREVHSFSRPDQSVENWSFNPDGGSVVASIQELADPPDAGRITIMVWNLSDGSERFKIDCDQGASAHAQFSPDGKRLAITVRQADGRNRVEIRDGLSGEELGRWEIEGDTLSAPAYSPDGARLAAIVSAVSATDPQVRTWSITLWDAATGAELASLPLSATPNQATHIPESYRVQFTSDGSRLVAEIQVSNQEQYRSSTMTITGWDGESEHALFEFTQKNFARETSAWAVSGDGQLIAIDDGSMVDIRDMTTGAVLRSLPESGLSSGLSLAFGPERTLHGLSGLEHKVWKIDDPTLCVISHARPNVVSGIASFDIHPDGELVAWYEQHNENGQRKDTVTVWNITTHEQVLSEQLPPNAPILSQVDFVSGGRYLVWMRSQQFDMGRPPSGPPDVSVWDTRSWKKVYEYRWESVDYFHPGFAIDPEGRRIAIVRPTPDRPDEFRLAVVDFKSGKELWYQELTGTLSAFPQFSPDGGRLAVSLFDNQMKGSEYAADKAIQYQVWDTETGKLLTTIHGIARTRLPVWSPDGKQLVSSTFPSWDALTLIDTSSGEVQHKASGERITMPVFWVAHRDFNPDGSRLATFVRTNRWNRTAGHASLFDTATGREVLAVTVPVDELLARLRFSRDGRRLFILSTDGEHGIKVRTLDATPLPEPTINEP
jgi:serine/threonine protein kinase/WD40 repeat protein